MSTSPKKKKIVKKKVVKKVVKKKVIKKKQPPISNGYSPKTNYNGHTKRNPMPKTATSQLHRTHRPSIEDAISRFTQIIEDQTKFIDKLKQENQKLKNEIEQLKKRPPEKIYIRKGPTKALPTLNVGTPGPPATSNTLQPPILKSVKSNPIMKNNNSGVVTNISKDDAKNALAGLFGAKKQESKESDSGVVTNISQNDAKNALAGLFGAKKSKSAMVLPKPKTISTEDDTGVNLNIKTPTRLIKYVKLGKIMPVHVVENRMKMDGITKILIGQLTKQWLKAMIPNGVNIIDKEAAPPPPMAKEFSDLIEKKDNNIDTDDDTYERLRALGLKPKKKIIPSRKMKRFHWKKIEPELIPPTLWKDINDEIVVYNKVEFELKFQFRTPRPTQKKKGIAKDRTGQIYTFVLPKRSQNIQIALSRFKLCDNKIKMAVIEMDEKVFDIETLEKFIEIAPNEDEQRETEMHANKEEVDPKYFGRSEKFFYEFIDMVDLNIRLDLWLFMMNFKEIVSDKQSQIYKLQSGIKELNNSNEFKNILQLLLAWGNHMNGGSHAGQAYGFEIDSLGILSGTKTMDTSMNLMMYLYKTLYERYPNYLNVMTQLKSVKLCATMETEMLEKTIIELKEKFTELEATVTRFEEDYLDVLPIEDEFINYSKKWIKNNKKHLTKLLMIHKRTKNKCLQLSQLFNWDLQQNKIEKLFTIINTFTNDLYKARDDIHKLEIEREKRRRKQKKKRQKQIAQREHNKNKKKKFENIQKPKRSIMDDVRNRKRKNTAILKKLGGKLDKSLVEKSKLIEATNYKKQLPVEFKKNKVKRKMSSVYNKQVKGTKSVPKGRMRLPTIVSKRGLPPLPSNNNSNNSNSNPNKKYQKNIKITKRKKLDRKRKRTKGWFEKGKEPKVEPIMNGNRKGVYAQPTMSYNPLAQYEENYKNAYRRGRGISNNKEIDGEMKGNRWRSDTPTNPTVLTQISKKDLNKGVNTAKKWSNAQHPALKNNNNNYSKDHKRAQSMKIHSSKNRLNRAAYSPPNMGIVRLNKLAINSNNNNMKKTKKKSGADLNIPQHLADGQDEFLLLESPAASPEPRKLSNYKFTEENSWD